MYTSQHFQNIPECVAFAALPLADDSIARTSRASRESRGENWCNTQSMEEAMGLALKGWPEGLAKVCPFADKLMGKLASRIQRETYEPAVIGAFFDVGIVLSGEPECWLSEVQTEQEGGAGSKVVTVSVSISAAGVMSSQQIEHRGGAVMALVQLLELAGKSVRVVAVLGAEWGSGNICDSTVVLKEASAPLNADQLAFWLVSPDALRRLAFAVREKLTEGAIIKDSQGRQTNAQHAQGADIKVLRLSPENYRHGLTQDGLEKQITEWLQGVGISVA